MNANVGINSSVGVASPSERIKMLMLNAVGLILSGTNVYGFNPVGIGFLSALNMNKGSGTISMVALLLGMTNDFNALAIMKNVAVLLATIIIFRLLAVGKLSLNEYAGAAICAGLMLIMEGADFLMSNPLHNGGREVWIKGVIVLAVSGLAGALCIMFRKGIKALLEGRQLYNNEESFSIALMIGLFIYNFGGRFEVPAAGLEMFIFFALLYSSYKYGIGMGAVIGAACSIPLCIWNKDVNYLGILCLMGILIGVFRELGRLVSIMVMLGMGAVSTYTFFPGLITDNMMKGMLGAAVIFLMLPKSLIYRYEENLNDNADEGIKRICEERLMNVAKTFERLSKSFFKNGNEMGNLYYVGQDTKNLTGQIWKSKFDESRFIMSSQLEQISKIIEEYSKQVYDFVKITNEEEEFIRHRLKSKKVYVDKIVGLENRRNKKEYLVTAKCEKGATVGSREIADVISEVMGKSYMPSRNCRKLISNDYTTTTYVEETNFYVLHGAAKKARGESGISGDNYSLRELENGQLLMGLSDGMGYGTSACLESETVIELLEQLLDSGFDAETSLKMINSVMIMNSDEDHPATLDYGVIDLHSGMCDMIKIGAAATFVKRGTWVETIKSTSMPLGIFSEVDYDSTSKKLYHGDMIIMVSDGVVDALDSENKDEELGRIISGIECSNPKEMADIILNQAVSDKSRLSDDMTVLVTGIWENSKKIA